MTADNLKALIAYLQKLANSNAKTTPVADTTEGGDSAQSLIAPLVRKGITSGVKGAWNEWGQPAWNEYVKPLYTEAAEAGTEAGAGAASTAGESSLSGLGGASWSSVMPYLSAALIGYKIYEGITGGSHRNEPKEKTYETVQDANRLSKLLSGYTPSKDNPMDLNDYFKDRRENLAAKDETFGNMEHYTDNPRSIASFYHNIHSLGPGWDQPQGLGSSEFANDQQIDDYLYSKGIDKAKLSAALGLKDMPDYSGGRKYKDIFGQINAESPDYYRNAFGYDPRDPGYGIPKNPYDLLA